MCAYEGRGGLEKLGWENIDVSYREGGVPASSFSRKAGEAGELEARDEEAHVGARLIRLYSVRRCDSNFIHLGDAFPKLRSKIKMRPCFQMALILLSFRRFLRKTL